MESAHQAGAALQVTADTSEYVCLPCGGPAQRACECNDEMKDTPDEHSELCKDDVAHWCYNENFAPIQREDNLFYCDRAQDPPAAKDARGATCDAACRRQLRKKHRLTKIIKLTEDTKTHQPTKRALQ